MTCFIRCFCFALCFLFSIFRMNGHVIKDSLKVAELEYKISTAEKGKKLDYLVALCNTLMYQKSYESVVREAATHAFEIDSLEVYTEQTSNLIYYLCNHKNKPSEALEVFDTYISRDVVVGNHIILTHLYLNAGLAYYLNSEMNKALAW